MDHTIARIEQKRFLHGRQTLTLDHHLLKVECRRWLSLHEYQFDLRGFGPHPTRARQVPLVKIVLFGMLTALTAALLAAGVGQAPDSGAGTLMGTLLLLLVPLWAWVVGETYDVVSFQGPGGRFVLWSDRPNKKEFIQFITLLSARIRNTQPGERHVLRQLHRAGIIDQWQYERAVDLFRHNGDTVENT